MIVLLGKLVLGGDDVFNFRRDFGLLQGECVNQDALIGNAASLSLEGAQGSAGVVEGLEHGHRLQVSGRWKAGDGVAGMHHKRAGMLGKHGFS